MGYYTTYELDWEPRTDEVEKWLQQRQNQDEGFAYGIDHDGSSVDESKWYEHENDIKELSKQFPDVVFTLSGEGEEAGDVWKKYFKDGKVQVAQAVVQIDKFNPTKLR